MDLTSEFSKLWRKIKGKNTKTVFAELEKLYAEDHRVYHTFSHIKSCLDLLETFNLDSDDKTKMQFAIWFHDAVYDTQSPDNEEKSSELFLKSIKGSSWENTENAKEVVELILATKHTNQRGKLLDIFLDIDLSILGQDDKVYKDYSNKIRFEYNWVPWKNFGLGRVLILRRFLERAKIFNTAELSHLEDRARVNLKAEIDEIVEKLTY